MLYDLEQNPALDPQLTADVCIVGAGPAGISLALTLARSNPSWHIVLLEAGGSDNANTRERNIYSVQPGEKSYNVLDISRRRKLGGTTAHWGGWCKPLDATDYEDNPRWDVPAWPLSPTDLTPFMPSALRWVEIASDQFQIESLQEIQARHLLSLAPDSGVAASLFRFSPPTRFGERYLDDLTEQTNLSCLLHANVYQVIEHNDRVTEVKAKPLDGDTYSVSAKQFVFAMGGMETTRLLLNMRDSKTDDGEGLYSYHLGRYFADHYGLRAGQMLAPEDIKYHRFSDSSGPIMPVLHFSAAHIRDQGQHNSCIMLTAVSDNNSLLQGYNSLSIPGLAQGSYWHYQTQMIVEPRPHPESQLLLTDERCELGLKRLKLEWRQHEDDFHSTYALHETLGQALSLSGQGRWQLSRPDSAEVRANVDGACHHLGTTRMASASDDGVVDPDLKVFGMENLYIASSSVFPRYGHANPTLTLIALSLRLAQHLSGKEELPA